jgi:hypothetical protein
MGNPTDNVGATRRVAPTNQYGGSPLPIWRVGAIIGQIKSIAAKRIARDAGGAHAGAQ